MSARKLWLAYARPIPNLVIGLWSPYWCELQADDAAPLHETLRSAGCLAFLGETQDEALAKLDDARGRCCLCADGFGAHRCTDCQQAVLEQQLEGSVRRAS